MGSNIDVSSTGALVNRLMNPPNPMQQLQQTVEGVNALKSFQANQASADAYRQSVDPVTGEVDLGKYKAIMSQGPGAWSFGPQTQQAGQAVGAVGQGTTADVNAKMTQLGAMGQLMYPLLKAGANNNNQIDPAAVQTQLDRAHDAHLVNDAQYNVWSSQLKGMTPADAYGFVLGANMGNQEAYRQLGGNVAMVNRGPVTQPVQTSPLGAQPPASATVSMGLTPEGSLKLASYLAEPYDYTDKQGVEHRGGTKADFFRDNNINPFKVFTDGTIPAPGSTPAIPAPAAAPAPEQPPPTAGSTPGSGNWEVQHNNFAGMRNPNVPAAGGPNTNPSGWQQFPTPEAGVQAISNQLDRYHSGATTGTPITTIRGIVSTWAPASDGNPTPTLIARASHIVGVDPDQPLNWDDPATKSKLVEAMIRNEQGGALPATAAAAIPKVFGGAPGATTAAPVPPPPGTTGPTAAIPEKTAAAGKEAYGTDQLVQSSLGTRVGPLESALSTLRAHPNMQTVGQDELNQLTELAHAFKFPIGNLDQANAYQELSKYLEGYMRNLPGANRSDLAQNQAAAASPHIGQGRDAMMNLLAKAVGYERMRAAGYDYFNQQFPDTATAATNSAQYSLKTAPWLAKQDPVAFAVDEMTPTQYSEYVAGLSPSAKDKFIASRREAMSLYPWLKLNTGSAPAVASP